MIVSFILQNDPSEVYQVPNYKAKNLLAHQIQAVGRFWSSKWNQLKSAWLREAQAK